MTTMEVICENVVDVVPEVVKWNSWDREHLRTVHKAYNDPLTLLTRPNDMLFIDRFKIPFLGLGIRTMVFTTQWDETREVSYTLTPFFVTKNTIEVIHLEEKKTKVRVKYEFDGNFFQALCFSLVKRMIIKWNKQVWDEDLPMKLRRQKALEYGFIDFNGIPKDRAKRIDRSINYRTKIPVPTLNDLKEDRHPFSLKRQ
jgi:hypothetical protein